MASHSPMLACSESGVAAIVALRRAEGHKAASPGGTGSTVWIMLQVTPNGPLGKDVHPNMPVSMSELLADLRACFLAGATGVHLHVRDLWGAETFEPVVVNQTCSRVRDLCAEVGADVEIGLTTGAWILPDLVERIAMIREWEGVDCATVNVSEPGFRDVMEAMLDVGIGIDAALWAPVDLELLVRSGMLPQALRVSLELDQGEPYFLRGEPAQVAQEMSDALDAAGSTCPRLLHGMNAWTWPLVEDAFRRGYDTRVGFEDSLSLPDGTRAETNAQLVEAAVALQRRIRS